MIGLDAATWDVMRPAIDYNKLPALNSLIRNGSSHVLVSTLPAHSAPGWTSAFTGVNPGKHGVFDFFRWEGYERKIVHSGDVSARYVWEIASDCNVKSIVVNVPMTFPPRPLNGVMVSGIPFVEGTKNFTFPATIQPKLQELGYEVDPKPSSPDKYDTLLLESETVRLDATIQLMEEHEWDLAVVVFTALDRIQHRYWKYFKNEGNLIEERLRGAIPNAYDKIDTLVARLLRAAGPSKVLVMSDHGFTSCKHIFFANEWLRRENYLVSKTTASKKAMRSFGITREGLKKKAPRSFRKIMPRKFARAIPTARASREDLNWDETKAWLSSPGSQGIIVKKSIEPIQSRDEVRKKLVESLSSLAIQSAEGGIVKRAMPREMLYWGDEVGKAPDVMLALEDGWRLSENIGGHLVETTEEGWHHREGILILSGDLPSQGRNGLRANIMDVAPTLLDMMGLPIPAHFDGKSLLKHK